VMCQNANTTQIISQTVFVTTTTTTTVYGFHWSTDYESGNNGTT